jgi:hypothetical protein
MIKKIVLLIGCFMTFSSFSSVYFAQIIEAKSNLDESADQFYELRVIKNVYGALPYSFTTLKQSDSFTNELMPVGAMVLVDENKGEGSILQRINLPINLSEIQYFSFYFAKKLSDLFNEINEHQHFIHHGSFNVAIDFRENDVVLSYDRLHMNTDASVIFDYYLKNESSEYSALIQSKSSLSYSVFVKENKILIVETPKNGQYYSLAMSLKKYESSE